MFKYINPWETFPIQTTGRSVNFASHLRILSIVTEKVEVARVAFSYGGRDMRLLAHLCADQEAEKGTCQCQADSLSLFSFIISLDSTLWDGAAHIHSRS